ncbi:hypothetical protein [Bdellovibrio sp. HCB2-146]|uniref:hypothetical protein n=1 Tax=Bdellovibrio sp. HCB2-146 TaxID=3394362 RepID=UPI0039BC3D16
MIKFFLTFLISVFASMAFAGPRVVGNGGISVVCRDSQSKQITEAYLLDLFEAESWGEEIPRSTEISELQLEKALKRLNESPGVQYEIRRTLKEIQDRTRILKNPRVGLPLTDDALPELTLKNCQYEQLALYDSASETLKIDGEILSALSPTDVAALWVHETLYKLDRRLYDATDSRKARALTRLLFSETATESLISEFNKIFHRFKTVAGQKILWLDHRQDFAIDLIADGVPAGTSCQIPALSKEQRNWIAQRDPSRFPNFEYQPAPWRDQVGPWINGAQGSTVIYCTVPHMNVSLTGTRFELKILQGNRELMTLQMQNFERTTPFQYRSTSTKIDHSDVAQYTIRLL